MIIDDIYNELKRADLNGYTLVRTGVKKLLLLKSKYKYSKCIYLNILDDCVEINMDKVYDNKYIYNGIERLYCFSDKFNNLDDTISYLISLIS